jgi:hypothetical protein
MFRDLEAGLGKTTKPMERESTYIQTGLVTRATGLTTNKYFALFYFLFLSSMEKESKAGQTQPNTKENISREKNMGLGLFFSPITVFTKASFI